MKNPAILWYPSDFISSTSFWTNEQCGAYIRLLNYQFVLGHLKIEQMQVITKDEEVLSKFIQDKKGLYYNVRMDFEKDKRTKYVESRGKNKKGKTKDMNIISKSYEIHMENENEDINIDKEYIVNYYIKYINNVMTPTDYEKLEYYFKLFKDDLKIIIYAIDLCVSNKGLHINYLCTILNSYEKKGYKTLQEVKEKEEQNRLGYKEKEPVILEEIEDYDWLNEED